MELQALHLQNYKYGLFLKRRFAPLFLATFLGAFNDNLLRSGLVIMIAYSSHTGLMLFGKPEILVTICSALLMLPFILFSSLAGSVADKYEKSRLVVIAKAVEIVIMFLVFYGFSQHNIKLLMCLLFISGTHTTFYGPIKFSILPDHLRKKELLAGNGFIAGGNYIAILFGLIAGGLLVEMPYNLIGYVAIGIATLGFIASLFIPLAPSSHPHTAIKLNLWSGTKEIVSYACLDRKVMLSIFALSWFLVVASLYMSQFANYAQAVVHANNEVYILFLIVFSVGTACGSLVCDTLLKGEISPRLTPLSALGLSLFTFLMVVTTPTGATGPLLDAAAFIAVPGHWLVMGCMTMVAFCGGIYIVPLYAMLQSHTPSEYRSRVMAASNLSDALFMTLSAIISAVLLYLGFTILDLFRVIAFLNLGVVWYARKVLS
jgi:acyl-[acyl-carrier-protein]-phospholipid O-acyltransferase/long-chain-fatty-acid--[acyl-carrier-protein] ligase